MKAAPLKISATASVAAHYKAYAEQLERALDLVDQSALEELVDALRDAWRGRKQVFLCGNGGSAGNAIHLANDLVYGVGKNTKIGMRAEALSANQAVTTCLANDLGYDEIYAQQLRVKANKGDVLIVLSGSGNSANVVKALEAGKQLGMTTFAILGYSGGKCKELAQTPIHIPLDDMQIAEDMQMILGHICMQHLCDNP